MTAERDESVVLTDSADFEQAYWRATPQVEWPLADLSPSSIPDDQFRLLADNLPTLCWMANGDGYIVWYNRRWHEYCGSTPEQMEGWGWQSVHDPALLPQVMERWTASVATGEPFEMTFPLRGADGVFRPFLTRIQPLRDADGKVARWFGVNTEISATAAAERALRESEERLRLVQAAAGIGSFDYDLQKDEAVCSPEYYQLFGLPAGHPINLASWTAAIHPDDRDEAAAALEEAVRERKPFDYEYRIVRADDGEVRWISGRATVIFDAEDRPWRYVGGNIDITERRREEERRSALIELGDRLRDLEDPADIAFAAAEILGRTLHVSRAGYGTIDPVAETITIERDWNAPGIESLAGVLHFRDYGSYIEDLKRGETVVFADAEKDPRTAATAEALKAISAQAVVNMPITELGGFVALLYLNHETARAWQPDEIDFIRDVAERTRTAVERRRVEQELRETEAQFREVFENAKVGMVEIDGEWRILGANAAYCEIADRPIDELMGDSCLAFTHPEDIGRSEQALRQAEEGGRVSFEKRYIHADGNAIWIRSNLSRVSPEGAPPRFIKVVEDVTARRAAEKRLREETRTLETLNRTGAAVAAELDLENVVQLVTDSGVELTGAQFGAFFYNVTDAAGESYMLFTLSGADPSQFGFGMPRNTKVFAPTFEGSGVMRSDDITQDPRYGQNPPHHGIPKGHLPVRSYLAVPVMARAGEVLGGLFFGHAEPGRFTERHERLMMGIAAQAAVAIDNARLYQAVQRANETLEQRVQERTAELETANEALRQAQKMEAIGQLTGGIAHDFNNMLTVIRGSTDILKRPSLDETKRERYIDAIADTADRASRLTSQLLAFARRQPLKPEVFDVAERVGGIADMLRTVLGSRIELEFESHCDDCFVEADTAQFETALLNMTVNARDAMDGEGKLRIEIAKGERETMPGSTEQCATVSVTDSGHGIRSEDMARIFDPFFTTKETGKGTGLGLSQVYGFVKQSGGDIEVRSHPGEGTTFTLCLPLATDKKPLEQASTALAPDISAGGRVLVVEDNHDVAAFAEQALGELGFTIQRAPNAAEALALLASGETFDVVFSDIVMPGQNGIEFAREIRRRWPQLPVVLTTGYSDALAVQADHGFPLLHKPYALEDLSSALAKALRR